MDCPKHDENLQHCNCSYGCEKKGTCCACLHYHRSKGQLPACYFSDRAEATYDRSVKAFVEDRQG